MISRIPFFSIGSRVCISGLPEDRSGSQCLIFALAERERECDSGAFMSLLDALSSPSSLKIEVERHILRLALYVTF